jgi:hypothetical protein
MNRKKAMLLSLFFFNTCLLIAQEKIVFDIDSVPIKSLTNIGGYQQKKIFIDGKNKARLFEKLFLKNRDIERDVSNITVVNMDIGEYLSVGSFLHDGSNWNNVFIVGYISPKQILKNDFQTHNLFKTNNGIQLGLDFEKVKKIMEIKPSVNSMKDSTLILKYYFYDFHDYRYEFFGMPKYMIAFRFNNLKLVKLGFGNFFDFFDADFSLDGFGDKEEFDEFIKNNYKSLLPN